MSGPEHWREADLILTADRCSYGCPHTGCEHEMAALLAAQVHATLALAAAAALGVLDFPQPQGSVLAAEWNRAIGVTS